MTKQELKELAEKERKFFVREEEKLRKNDGLPYFLPATKLILANKAFLSGFYVGVARMIELYALEIERLLDLSQAQRNKIKKDLAEKGLKPCKAPKPKKAKKTENTTTESSPETVK